jgi:MOSC domain-containing protein YiiM
MVESGYCGAYLGVIEAATLRAGESFTVEPGPRDVNIVDIFRSRTAGKRF